MNRFAPEKRIHIRRTVLLLGIYLLALGLAPALSGFGADSKAKTVRTAADFLGFMTLINVSAVILFDLLLPAVRLEPAQLVEDLTVGAAYAVAVFVGVRRMGLNPTEVVATSAVVTGILALSLQATLGNVVGGVALQLDNSIQVGDWVQLENGKQGRIRAIRWRHTVIETRDWGTLIVPNASLLSATIQILGKRQGEPLQHRMWVYFNVDYRHNPAEVISAVETALQSAAIDGVASRPKPNCVCMDFNRDSFALYAVRYWLTDLAHDDGTNSAVRTRIYAALKRANIPLAVPAAQIFVDQDNTERREQKRARELQSRVQALRQVALLNPLREEELVSVAENLRYAPFATGETVTKQGAVAHWLYILTEGDVEVTVRIQNADRVVAKLSAPSFFGEMGLMTGEPREATVLAVTNVVCYRLEKETFHQIMRDRPEIAEEISGLLAKRRVELETAREDLDSATKQKRLLAEERHLLATIRTFFGLDEDVRS